MSGTEAIASPLERELVSVKWFAEVSQPSSWDELSVRLADWDEWPGPENPRVLDLALELQSLHDAVSGGATEDRRPDLEQRMSDINQRVLNDAKNYVAFDPEQDAWHGPTQCVWDAAYTAGVIAGFQFLGWPVAEDLVELWAWYRSGHWPCGFGDPDGAGLRRLMVL